jgi:peptidoglycan-associated lipoprotein
LEQCFKTYLNSAVTQRLIGLGEEQEMLLKSKRTLAVLVVALGLATACTDDEKKVDEVVTPAPTEDVETPPVEAPTAYTPSTVYFAFDDYTLSMDAQNQLQGLADYLKKSQGTVVQIEGHCDERGSIEYNLALGERRAQSVKNYVTQLGVEGARVSTISYGEEKPASDGHDEAAWSKNRRAEFTMTNQ